MSCRLDGDVVEHWDVLRPLPEHPKGACCSTRSQSGLAKPAHLRVYVADTHETFERAVGLDRRRAVLATMSVVAAVPADELDDDAHQPSGYHDDLVWCGTSKQLNDAGCCSAASCTAVGSVSAGSCSRAALSR